MGRFHDVPNRLNTPRALGASVSSLPAEGLEVRAPLSCPHCKTTYDSGIAFCPMDGHKLVPGQIDDPRLGQLVDGRFQLLELLGEGAMGRVYRASQSGLGREVAVKLLKSPASPDSRVVQRFLREVRTIARLNHANIVTLFDFGHTSEHEPFLVMELIRGRTLKDVLDAERPDLVRTVRLFGQMCDALETAHAQHVIHRDLKPTNVMVVAAQGHHEEQVKLLDFGLAKLSEPDFSEASLTQTGHICGTPLYMSPEQALGLELDCRSDVYSLGVILYEMLLGRAPFEADSVVGLLRAHVQREPVRPRNLPEGRHVTTAMESVLLRALAKEPSDRFASAWEFRNALVEANEQRVGDPLAEFEGLTQDDRLGPGRAVAAAVDMCFDATQSAEALAPPQESSPFDPHAPFTLPGMEQLPGGARAAKATSQAEPAPKPAPLRQPNQRQTRGPVQPEATPPLRQPTPRFHQPTPRAGARAVPTGRPVGRVDGLADSILPTAPPREKPTKPETTATPQRSTSPSTGPSASAVASGARRRAGREKAPNLPQRPTSPTRSEPKPGGTEATRLEEQALEAERLLRALKLRNSPKRAWCEANLAEIRYHQGRMREAEEYAASVVRQLREDGERSVLARAATVLAHVAEGQQDLSRACDWLDLAVEALQRGDDEARLAETSAWQGAMLFKLGHHAAARPALERALALDEKLGRSDAMATDLRCLAANSVSLGRVDEAEELLRRALELALRQGDRPGVAYCYHHLGRAAEKGERYDDATKWHEKALKIREELGDRRDVSATLLHVGNIKLKLRQLNAARMYFEKAYDVFDGLGDELHAAMALRRVGDVAVREANITKAYDAFSRSEAIFKKLGSQLAGGRAHQLLTLRPSRSRFKMEGIVEP